MRKRIAIGPSDVAVVIRGDGQIEAHLPKQGDEHGLVLPQTMTGALLLLVARDPELIEELRGRLMPNEASA